ncbi:hypothetical protein GCM10009678_94560 [Actinomadura kijaniata]|uniref:Uncharacterized protein n=1 Tax=Actinomadura namibiensis TaxID=182080 RepID=A0A7W3QRS1_ACTNM|nr:hypothetical protein [Actinomadura namibiensis]MBA8956668.1 hypothetical protein [Actinomadura namibiensis]
MTTTIALVLVCLAVAGRELFLAFDKRLPRAQAELRELRTQVAELAGRHEALRAEVTGPGEQPAEPPAEDALPDETRQVLDRVDSLGDRVERLEQEIGGLAGELTALDFDHDAQRALARSLDVLENSVAELQQEMLDRLARQEGVAPGLLLSEEGEAEALLTEAFERCVSEYGLRVRIRDHRTAQAANGGYWGTAYHLSGRRPDALGEELFAYVRGLYDPQDPSALAALLNEMASLRGGGVARLGPFTVVRTPNALLCGLLTESDEAPGEPWELAAHLRELPEDVQCDLTWLRTDA